MEQVIESYLGTGSTQKSILHSDSIKKETLQFLEYIQGLSFHVHDFLAFNSKDVGLVLIFLKEFLDFL
jgi:hypothetical protein